MNPFFKKTVHAEAFFQSEAQRCAEFSQLGEISPSIPKNPVFNPISSPSLGLPPAFNMDDLLKEHAHHLAQQKYRFLHLILSKYTEEARDRLYKEIVTSKTKESVPRAGTGMDRLYFFLRHISNYEQKYFEVFSKSTFNGLHGKLDTTQMRDFVLLYQHSGEYLIPSKIKSAIANLENRWTRLKQKLEEGSGNLDFSEKEAALMREINLYSSVNRITSPLVKFERSKSWMLPFSKSLLAQR